MGDDKVYDDATKVSAKDGEVILDGPDGVDVKLTPDAPVETGERLIDGGAEAAGQRYLDKKSLSKPKHPKA